jgi:hypothetical protein
MKTHGKTRTIDWQACEREYRSGVMSLREMGSAYGVTESAIRKRAKRDEWTRDLHAKIQAKANELVRKQEVRNLVRTESAVSDKMQIQAMGQLVAGVQMGHKAIAARGLKLCHALLAELETQTFDTVVFAQLGELMRNPDDSGMDKLDTLYKKVISLPGRVDTARKLMESMKSVIAMEREAYGIDSIPTTDTPVNSIAAFLASMKCSALPVVYEVEADDSL